MTMDNEIKRQEGTRSKILHALRKAGVNGLTNVELSKIAVRYGGSLGDLYKRGYSIDKQNLGNGVYKYTLVEEPDEEVVNHKKAVDILLHEVSKAGLVDSDELKWMLEELGLNIKRKANTFKKGALV